MSARTRLFVARLLWPVKVLQGLGAVPGEIRRSIMQSDSDSKGLWVLAFFLMGAGGAALWVSPLQWEHPRTLSGLFDAMSNDIFTFLGSLGLGSGIFLVSFMGVTEFFFNRHPLSKAIDRYYGDLKELQEQARLEKVLPRASTDSARKKTRL
jgi:hypothetical protein